MFFNKYCKVVLAASKKEKEKTRKKMQTVRDSFVRESIENVTAIFRNLKKARLSSAASINYRRSEAESHLQARCGILLVFSFILP